MGRRPSSSLQTSSSKVSAPLLGAGSWCQRAQDDGLSVSKVASRRCVRLHSSGFSSGRIPPTMSPHKFSVGQNVEFLPGTFDHNIPRGTYVITRTLPGDDFDRTYGARSVKDGVERVFRE